LSITFSFGKKGVMEKSKALGKIERKVDGPKERKLVCH
jgi:hypothetical protein